MAIFPDYEMAKRHGYVNFGAFAAERSTLKDRLREPNPDSKPKGQESRKQQIHDIYGLDWYYGGWMEDRSIVWSDTYLRETGNFLHLGIDCSVSALTRVLAVAEGEILFSGTDAPLKGGWGGFVVQRIRFQGEDCVLIYGHLGKRTVEAGTFASKGTLIGEIGTKKVNGGWGEHLHLQIVRQVEHVSDWWTFFDQEMDGYGKLKDIAYWARRCPDPTPLIF